MRAKSDTFWVVALRYMVAGVLLFFATGCVNPNTVPSQETDNPVIENHKSSVLLNLKMQSKLQQLLVKYPSDNFDVSSKSVSSHQRTTKIVEYFTGTLTIKEGQTVIDTIQITASIDNISWQAELFSKIVLSPGIYTFELILSKNSFQYFGATVAELFEGQNNLSMQIYPVIGDTILTTQTVSELGSFKFEYTDLIGMVGFDPKLGIIVDGGNELVMDVSLDTGMTETYLNLSVGAHVIELKLYDGQQQKGRSIPEEENQTVIAGQNITMNLIPVHASSDYTMSVGGGDASFDIIIPSEIVVQAGGIGNLKVPFLLNGAGTGYNPQEGEISSFSHDISADEYTGQISFTGTFFYSDIHVYVEFIKSAEQVLIGTCNFQSSLNTETRTALCSVPVTNSLISSGKILGTAGVTVCEADASGDCLTLVGGANVYRLDASGDDLLGITGSGIVNNQGSLKAHLPPGVHTIRAVAGDGSGSFGESSVTISPLGVENVEIIFSASAPTNPGISINAGDPFTYSNYATLSLTAEDANGITAYYVSEVGTAPGDTGWISVSPASNFNLMTSFAMSAGTGEKTIYAWYKNAAGHRSERVEDTIVVQDDTSLYYNNFTLTTNYYDAPTDASGDSWCLSEFGAGYRSLDWQEIVTIITQDPAVTTAGFKSDMSITNSTANPPPTLGGGAFVTYNGNGDVNGEYFAIKEPKATVQRDTRKGWNYYPVAPLPDASAAPADQLQLFYVETGMQARVMCYRDTGVHPLLNGDFGDGLDFWNHVSGSANAASGALVLQTYEASGDHSRVEQDAIAVRPNTDYQIDLKMKTSVQDLYLTVGVIGGNVSSASYDIAPSYWYVNADSIDMAGENSDPSADNYFFNIQLTVSTDLTADEMTLYLEFDNDPSNDLQSGSIDEITLQEL